MPMSPRLLRPIASRSLVDADAAAYLTAVQSADQQALEPAVRNAITAFVIGCKQDGIWSAIKASCILMGARTLSGALTPLVGSAPTNNGPFVSGDYNRETGLVGNGSTKYLNSNRNNNADPQDSQHLAVYASTVGAGTYMGCLAAPTFGFSSIGLNATRSRNSTSISWTSSAGLIGISRASSSDYNRRIGGVSSTEAQSSQTPLNSTLNVLESGTVYGSHRLAFYSIGESLNLALLDTRVSALYNAIGAAI